MFTALKEGDDGKVEPAVAIEAPSDKAAEDTSDEQAWIALYTKTKAGKLKAALEMKGAEKETTVGGRRLAALDDVERAKMWAPKEVMRLRDVEADVVQYKMASHSQKQINKEGKMRWQLTSGDIELADLDVGGGRRLAEATAVEGKVAPTKAALFTLLTEDEKVKAELDAPRGNETR